MFNFCPIMSASNRCIGGGKLAWDKNQAYGLLQAHINLWAGLKDK